MLENKIEWSSSPLGIIVNGELIEKSTLDKKFSEMSANEAVLITIDWPWDRNFSGISESFVVYTTDIDVNALLLELDNTYVGFGEIEGKHSDVYGTLDLDDILIEYDESKVSEFIVKYPSKHFTCRGHSFIEQIKVSILDGELKSDEYPQLNKLDL